jgi:hypothetical protein
VLLGSLQPSSWVFIASSSLPFLAPIFILHSSFFIQVFAQRCQFILIRQVDAGIALSPFAGKDGNGDHMVTMGYVSSQPDIATSNPS